MSTTPQAPVVEAPPVDATKPSTASSEVNTSIPVVMASAKDTPKLQFSTSRFVCGADLCSNAMIREGNLVYCPNEQCPNIYTAVIARPDPQNPGQTKEVEITIVPTFVITIQASEIHPTNQVR